MRAVLDASVIVKWILPDPERESGLKQAMLLLTAVREGRLAPLQPSHWLAEVTAAVTRIRPEIAPQAIDLLDAMELPVVSDATVLKSASHLAQDLNHHLFDTLYHALALEYGMTLISADEKYVRKARHLGGIVSLESWREGQ